MRWWRGQNFEKSQWKNGFLLIFHITMQCRCQLLVSKRCFWLIIQIFSFVIGNFRHLFLVTNDRIYEFHLQSPDSLHDLCFSLFLHWWIHHYGNVYLLASVCKEKELNRKLFNVIMELISSWLCYVHIGLYVTDYNL